MNSEVAESDKLFSYLLEELKNSFSSQAHIEQQRNKYLAFYLAFIMGSATVILRLFDTPKISESLDVILFIVANSILIFSITLLSAIKKLGIGLKRHQERILWIREKLTETSSFNHESMNKLYNNSHSINQSRIFNTQASSENILIVSSFTVIIAVIYNAIQNILDDTIQLYSPIFCIIIELFLGGYLLKVISMKFRNSKD